MNDITNRKDLEGLIEVFYGRVFADEQIGVVFLEVPGVTPETHFPLMADFWETVLFARNRYHNNVIQNHLELHQKHPLTPLYFERWLDLFGQTVDELFDGPMAETAKTRARTMAMALQTKLKTVSPLQQANEHATR